MVRSRKNLFTTGYGKTNRESTSIELSPEWRAELKTIIQVLSDSKKIRLKEYRMRTALLTAVGLCVSLLLVIGAFEWKSYSENELIELGSISAEFEEILDIPVTEQPPPPAPQAQVANILEVPDVVEIQEEIEISLDVEVTEESVIEEVVYETLAVEEEVAEEIFQFVEQQPEPQGGMKAFYKYVAEHLTYPQQARRAGIEGKVYLQFVINKDGSITDVVVLKGIGFGCDEEAKKVLASSPHWSPGKQRGQPVNVRMSLPIVFVLENV